MYGALDIPYNCCEQFMMAAKAKLMNDYDSVQAIMSAISPMEQKRLGRLVQNYDDKLWNEKRLDVVYIGNYYKFSQNEDLKLRLLATGDTLLVEASPFDTIWGIGLDEIQAKKVGPDKWPGKNYLGKVLTLVREDLLNNVNPDQNIYTRFQNMGWL